MSEIWRPVEGFSKYQVSNLGRVKGPKCILKPGTHSQGYLLVTLMTDNNAKKVITVHILVCTAFHGPKPFPRAVVRHKNHVKSDNREDNLHWGTHIDNAQDDILDGRKTCGVGVKTAVLTEDLVWEIHRRVALGEKGFTIAKSLGIASRTCYDVIQGKTWKHIQLEVA